MNQRATGLFITTPDNATRPAEADDTGSHVMSEQKSAELHAYFHVGGIPAMRELLRRAAEWVHRRTHPDCPDIVHELKSAIDHLDALDDDVRRLSPAAVDVLEERRRQVEQEGWSEGHDDGHWMGELVAAATCYAANALKHIHGATIPSDSTADEPPPARLDWPWDENWWKPKNVRRDLVRAAALVLAEIDRLDRLAEPAPRAGDTDVATSSDGRQRSRCSQCGSPDGEHYDTGCPERVVPVEELSRDGIRYAPDRSFDLGMTLAEAQRFAGGLGID